MDGGRRMTARISGTHHTKYAKPSFQGLFQRASPEDPAIIIEYTRTTIALAVGVEQRADQNSSDVQVHTQTRRRDWRTTKPCYGVSNDNTTNKMDVRSTSIHLGDGSLINTPVSSTCSVHRMRYTLLLPPFAGYRVIRFPNSTPYI